MGGHVAGLLDFPNATVYASRYALRQALNVSSIIALSKGALKNLLPHNLEERTKIIEDFGVKNHDPILGTMYDLFADNSLFVISLPGHARGQVDYFRNPKKKIFISGRCCLAKTLVSRNDTT